MAVGPSDLEKPFRGLVTPAFPYTREKAFKVLVSADFSNVDRLPIIGTTYANANICQTRMSEFSSYICSDVKGEGDYWWFYFSKDKTAAQAWTRFKEPEEELRNHSWPLELLKVTTYYETIPFAANLGNKVRSGYRWHAVASYRERPDTGTLFSLSEFLMPTRPVIPQDVGPNPEPITFPLPNNKPFSFPPSLHGAFIIDAMQDAVQEYDTAGASVTSGLSVAGPYQISATNMKTCLPYVLYTIPQRTEVGAYLVRQMMVTPPAASRIKTS
jgi:hypothetical protein